LQNWASDISQSLNGYWETFISSREPKVHDLAQRIRDHRSIENQQHYILDAIFSEDTSRSATATAPMFLLYIVG
jgi:predicted transposase YbfD/YdcC